MPFARRSGTDLAGTQPQKDVQLTLAVRAHVSRVCADRRTQAGWIQDCCTREAAMMRTGSVIALIPARSPSATVEVTAAGSWRQALEA